MTSSPSSSSSSSIPSSSSPSSSSITLTISFRGKSHVLSLLPDTPLDGLHALIEERTEVPPALQKLLWKGKKMGGGGDSALGKGKGEGESNGTTLTLEQAGLRDGVRIQMLGSTRREVEGVRAVESENAHRERIMRERALKPAVKLRATGTGNGPVSSFSSSSSPASSSSLTQYKFHTLEPLPHLPNPASALALLTKLAEDPAIRHVMQQHRFSVGVLTELAPHEHPELLGLNENAGQKIKLRLRTDKYDGFRLYSEVRRVLCHELTHNVWGDHDENFKSLNSKLNKEVAEYERAVSEGTHYLSGGAGQDVYQPASELEAEARAYTLGGGALSSGAGSGSASASAFDTETQEERRRRVLEATMSRLRREEEDIEHSCGTGAGAGHSTTA